MSEKVIAGADFSGARDVPNQTWLAVGRLDALGLTIDELKQTGSHRLAQDVAAHKDVACLGLDFPFSLPAEFLTFCAQKAGKEPFQSWQEAVEYLVFVPFEEFLALAKEFAKEPKRVTDLDYKAVAQSPLHRGNPSMVQMTYQGMRMLAGLDPGRFAVVPFREPSAGGCSVIEVFPRGTLWCLGLPDSGYKSKEKKDQEKMHGARRNLLTQLIDLRERKGALAKDYPRLSVDKRLQHMAVESDDALDAIIACYSAAVWHSVPDLFRDPYDADNEDVLLEGWIYAPLKSREAKA